MDLRDEVKELIEVTKNFTKQMEEVLKEEEKIMGEIHSSLMKLASSNYRMIQILRDLSNQ